MAAETLEARVAAAVAARRPELGELVRKMIDAELDRLVADELAVRGNGAAGSTAVAPPDPNALRRCTSCGRELPANAFQPQRRQCRQCRTVYQRTRLRKRRTTAAKPAADDGDDGPRAGAA